MSSEAQVHRLPRRLGRWASPGRPLRRAAGAALIAVCLLGCGSQAHRRVAAAQAGDGARSSSVSYAVLSYLFPRDGADATAGAVFQSFEGAVMTREEAGCLSRDGLPGPPAVAPPPLVGTANFPDFAAIAQHHGLLLIQRQPAFADPTAHMTAPARHAYFAALTRCRNAARKPFLQFDGGAGASHALQQEWMNDIVTSVDASGPVQSAGRTALACARQRGYSFRPIDGDYTVGAVLDATAVVFPLAQKGELAKAHAADARVADILVKCLEPVSELRSRLLAPRRARFFDVNAAAVRQIMAQAQGAVDALRRRYRIEA